MEKQGRGPVYVYELTRDLPGDDKGPFHAADLWYVFKTFMRAWRPWTGRDFELARDMNTYWANFAKNLDPNGKGLPQWTPYTAQKPEVMVFGNEKTEMQRLPEDACTAFRRQYLLNP
ncbi:MAG: carboxylesterase family protein [Subdoligranulum sp.]|nr:carboxylesterase family protein [Subdoligranulum sp.]